MDDDQQFCLRWNNHQSTLISVFDTLLENETLVDCTLAAEGKYLKAHKVVLSACSPYFATLLQEQYDKHPIFILKDVKYQELRAMMDYMYRGEVNISQDQLAALLKAAESLQIKGLSDNRSGGGASQPKPDHHRASMPGKLSGGYTLEQTKRARITGAGGPAMDASEIGSREGSSSPSRRRRKVRRRSIENAMTDVHDNSNSSQQPTQSNASGLGAITALAAAAAAVPTTAALASTVVPLSATQQQPQQSSSSAVVPAAPGTTLSSSKKTDNVKGSTQHQQQQQDAMNTDNVQGPAASATPAMDTEATDASAADKSNHKQQKSAATAGASKDTSSVTGSELVIEPKAEYDDEANDENVEDLTLDEEDMGMDDLDHNAGTSQGGEGSSQGYAPWQHDRSQDELLLATQEAQQRDPQDLSITRIAGLTWNEWNARLAMPLVTQLREGVHPLVFPTDLTMEKGAAGNAGGGGVSSAAGNGLNARDICKIELKSPLKRSALSVSSPPPNELSNSEQQQATQGASSTPLNCSSASEKDRTTPTGPKLKHLTQEEATVLMLKAAAEKSANNSGNLSDNSYSDDPTPGNVSSGGGGGGSSDFHSAFADVGPTGLSINILNSINAMNSLISGGGNGGLSLSSAAALGVGGAAGAGNGAGHPCPECGRLYKLKSSLRNHQKWECGKEPQFQCPFCVYRAKQKMHIGRHMERMHKEKFFKVEDLKSFTTATIGNQLTQGAGGGGASGGGSGGGGGGSAAGSTIGAEDTSTAVAELRQHYS
ncbi:longitudinals lacking protein, isoforms A/B/D/L isoform X8 [Stomoxys calcitrans]|uniref:longitudinals lacking protein, isoforms A/B/D/L isoform X8 n=1 Tax=Stomoxys calcitrans TaxID=35570 RepID=UPI0027E22769|nr:longitudinals lacking protein, isoforms A/B/D/L isoform X8 [Stomoxys calcitrans]